MTDRTTRPSTARSTPGVVPIHGHCHPSFAEVAEEFERNFSERGDLGASVCVIVGGEEVVNLWGGVADPDRNTPWQEDTLTVVMSVTKGATALCAHILADRGLLDFDAPVADYWPEFAAHGKEAIPVRMLLNHQAGLPAVRTPLPEGKFCDWEYMVAALADEVPFWEPGTRIGYHAFTFGWLVGEVIRRVSGRSPGTFFREEVAGPLGLDFWIGLPASELHRVTPLRSNPASPLWEALASEPDSQSALRLAFENSGGHLSPGGWNTPVAYGAEICAAGGITNGRALARLYAPLSLGGTFEGMQLVSPETIQRMSTVQSAITTELTVGLSDAFTLGYMKTGRDSGLPDSIFGHSGFGGAMGFADPDAGVAFGYVMNQMNPTSRWEPLAEAAYRALGYRRGKFGLWMR
jgi:CubicO group peptidase (beta-lactamase class C family)